MNVELILLSSKIATWALIGTLAGVIVGWLWRGYLARWRSADFTAKLDIEHQLRKSLEEQVEGAKTQAHQLARTSKEADLQVMTALHQRDEAEKHAADVMNRLRGIQEQLDRAQRDSVEKTIYDELHTETRDRLIAKDTRITELEQAAKELQAVRDTAVAEAEANVARLTADLEAAQTMLSEQAQTTPLGGEQLASVQAELEATNAKLAQLEQAAKEQQAQREAAVAEAEAKVAEAEAKVARLTADLDAAQTMLSEQEQTSTGHSSQLASVQAELEAANAKLAQLELTANDLQAQLAIAKSELQGRPVAASPKQRILVPKALPIAEPTETLEFPNFPPAPERDVREMLKFLPPLKRGPKPQLETAREIRSALEASLAAATEEDSRQALSRQIEWLNTTISQAEAVGQDTDDLSQIKGIKGALKKQLQEHAVYTFAQIAGWTDNDLAILAQLIPTKDKPVKDNWIEQAADLAQRKAAQ